jgi:hypothetical protein
MTNSEDTAVRIMQAVDLPELLDAAHEAFEYILGLLNAHQDPASGFFVPMVYAAASAANGRDYIGSAPSLPPSPLRPPPHAETHTSFPQDHAAARWTADVCTELASRLSTAASFAVTAADRRACAGAARCAREITGLMNGPPA